MLPQWVYDTSWYMRIMTDLPNRHPTRSRYNMMTSSNGNIFRITGPFLGESNGHRWIPLTKTSDRELWFILWSASEQAAEVTIKTPVIWNPFALIMTSL